MPNMIPVEGNNMPVEIEQDSIPVPAEGKCLYITQDSQHFDFHALLGQIVQCVNMGEILDEIKAGTQYVVQIPAEFQAAYESGEMFIMENMKTGKMWPSLMKIAENGKQQVITPLPIAEQAIVQGNPVQQLANGHYNMLMQQQVAQLTELLERTYRAVERIEHGQMDDRIGLLEAGKTGLILAMSMPEGDDRSRQIDSSRQNLLVAQAQIEKALERRAHEFDPLPKAAPIRFLREVAHNGYLAEKRRAVQEMQEYYDLYLQATKLLAASYVMCGNLQTAEETFRLSEATIRTIDFSKVATIRYQHKELADMFYSTPAEYIATERVVCLEEAKHYDYVALEVSGEELLEVIENE
ncbi:MAG: hypothetical protein IKW00_05600 [Clostridia bacterium]|nr:hypothetical protein [Clostridia bacterium]